MLAHVHSLCHKPVIWHYYLGMKSKRTFKFKGPKTNWQSAIADFFCHASIAIIFSKEAKEGAQALWQGNHLLPGTAAPLWGLL